MCLLLIIFIFHNFLSLKTIGTLCSNVKNIKSCLHYEFPHSILHDISKCDKNQQWIVIGFRTWQIAPDQILNRHFSAERDRGNYIREVKNAIFSVVYPTPLKIRPRLAAVAHNVLLEVLDIDPEQAIRSETFLKFVNGDSYDPHVLPLSHRYGGHQFGYWSGQLGDGRAVMLGEYVNHLGERWELQLKGSGLTPYSRQGDGKAVIRSSVREFLCSEAMHALGIGTSRAASLVVSDDPVKRDQFYNGNVKVERAAVVLRLAQSWFRIGSLEILAVNNEIELLRSLIDFVIKNYFQNINVSDPNRILALFQEIVRGTAKLISQWQSVGFTHGVCNTDNFSLLSITIDYGPFGFLEGYDPNFVPNTSDDEGRYSYGKQPDIGMFNLNKLKIALSPLLNKRQQKQADVIRRGYTEEYKSNFMEIFMRKLGFRGRRSYTEDDEQFVAVLLKIMEDTKADFTMTFREMSELTLDNLEILSKSDDYENDNLISTETDLWAVPKLISHDWFQYWLDMYRRKMAEGGVFEKQRRETMLKTNPRYILRNWIAQVAIEHTEKNNFTFVNKVLKILENPYVYNQEAEDLGFGGQPPDWAQTLKVSCSS